MKIKQRGIVLVLVLWMIILLTIIAVTYSQSSRTETLSTANNVNQLKAIAAAEAGIHIVINDLLKIQNEQEWSQDGQAFLTQFDQAELSISLRNTAGLIDINTVSDTLLLRLFEAVLPEDEHQATVDAILDWRDPDNLKRNLGAEKDEYRRLNIEPSAKNGPFNTVNELLNVLGMTQDLYQEIYPYLTVHSQHKFLNPKYADETLLYYFSDDENFKSNNDLNQNTDRNKAEVNDLISTYPELFSNVKRNTFKISSIATYNSSKARLDVEIILAPKGKNPYTLLSWKRNNWPLAKDKSETAE